MRFPQPSESMALCSEMEASGYSLLSRRAIVALGGLILLGAAVVGVLGRSALSPVQAAQAIAKSDHPTKTLLEVLQGRTPNDAAVMRLINVKAKSVPTPAVEELGMGRGRNRLIPRSAGAPALFGSALTEALAPLPPTDLAGASSVLIPSPGLGVLDGLVLPAVEFGAQSPPAGGGLTLANPVGSLGDVDEVPAPSATPTSGSATAVTAVPEPSTWGLMLIGFLFVGIGLRRRVRLDGQTIETR